MQPDPRANHPERMSPYVRVHVLIRGSILYNKITFWGVTIGFFHRVPVKGAFKGDPLRAYKGAKRL